MCGIVGAVAERNVQSLLIEGLKRLEYRGYDSAGLAIVSPEHAIARHRTLGKVRALEEVAKATMLQGMLGIAHTRWATHGSPSEDNAHPHITQDGSIALVHNGIIENHAELRRLLLEKGYRFESETDTEVIVHLLHSLFQTNKDPIQALQATANQLQGAYGLGVVFTDDPEHLYGIRHGSPLVVGKGINENFIASDYLALLPLTQKIMYLEEGDIVKLSKNALSVVDKKGRIADRPFHEIQQTTTISDRGEFRHFMLKEIMEQPTAIRQTLEGCFEGNHISTQLFGVHSDTIFKKAERVHIVACGTSYHAGVVARYWLESLAKIPCSVEIASEWRYRQKVIPPNSLFVCISQSGETADTLSALKEAKSLGYLATLGICNVAQSSLIRACDFHFLTQAGAEIGVASTKAFTTQLVALLLMTAAIGKQQGLEPEAEAQLISGLKALPQHVDTLLGSAKQIESIATLFTNKQHALFLGRGTEYPIALEGALKLKEVSYIHAEGYPAGELKHGPLALIDEEMPVVAVAPPNALFEKIKSNLEEVRARGGQLIVFTEENAAIEQTKDCLVVPLPIINSILTPIAYTIPLQLLAYYVAVIKGTDIDQPRNLAKSVTVE